MMDSESEGRREIKVEEDFRVRHYIIVLKGYVGEWKVEKKGSANSTFVNERRRTCDLM